MSFIEVFFDVFGNAMLPVSAMFLFIIFIFSLFPLVRGLRIHRHFKHASIIDVSHLNLEPPIEIHYLIDVQRELGFRRLGEHHISFKGQLLTTWCFVNSDETTIMELVNLPPLEPMLELSTWHKDDALVETIYPSGGNISDPDYRSHGVGTSLEEAYKDHLSQVKEFQRLHGLPIRIVTMQSWLQRDSVFHELYRDRKNKAQFIRKYIVPSATYLYAALLSFVGSLLFNYVSIPVFLTTFFVLAVPLLIAIRWAVVGRWNGRKPNFIHQDQVRQPRGTLCWVKIIFVALLMFPIISLLDTEMISLLLVIILVLYAVFNTIKQKSQKRNKE